MPNKETASDTTALLQGSQLLQKGRADVFRQRERTKFKRIIRAIVVIGLIDLYLWYRYSIRPPTHAAVPARRLGVPALPAPDLDPGVAHGRACR